MVSWGFILSEYWFGGHKVPGLLGMAAVHLPVYISHNPQSGDTTVTGHTPGGRNRGGIPYGFDPEKEEWKKIGNTQRNGGNGGNGEWKETRDSIYEESFYEHAAQTSKVKRWFLTVDDIFTFHMHLMVGAPERSLGSAELGT